MSASSHLTRCLRENTRSNSLVGKLIRQGSRSIKTSFDTGKRASGKAEPERFPSAKATTKGLKEPSPSVCFYHGFVFELMVDLKGRHVITSNRASGLGRYDVILEPLSAADDAIIIEFKVYNFRKEKSLKETLQNALQQIEDKK